MHCSSKPVAAVPTVRLTSALVGVSGAQIHPVVRRASRSWVAPVESAPSDSPGGGCLLVVSLLYLLFPLAAAVPALRFRWRALKGLGLVVLRHAPAVVPRQGPR